MVMMVGSALVQGAEGAGFVATAAKVVNGTVYTVAGVAFGVLGGGLLGAKGLGTLVEKYYDWYGDPHKMRSANIGLSVAAGGIGGAVIGGGIAVTIALNSLGLL